jgi:isopentenyl-diphosphate Delta-isomerase
VAVETKRAEAAQDHAARALGEALWDWGIPTAASVGMLAPLGFETVVATGGVATGLDVARAVALGASAAGIARPMLKALTSGGRAAAVAFLEGILTELRAVMLLTGSADVASLRKAPRLLGAELRMWIDGR